MHTAFAIGELDPGGSHRTRTSTSSRRACSCWRAKWSWTRTKARSRSAPGDYALIPVGAPHAPAQRRPTRRRGWAAMSAPQPRAPARRRHVLRPAAPGARRPCRWTSAIRGRGRSATSTRGNMEVDRQTQDMLAVSASMRTALLVYSGITVKMMIDRDLGAQLSTMFMVQYEPRGHRRAARPSVRGDVPDPRGRGRRRVRRRERTGW